MDIPGEASEKNILRRVLERAVRFFYVNLIEPKSENEDSRRKEFILNILLLASIALVFILTLSVVYQSSIKGDEYTGVLPEVPLIVLLIFVFLLVLSRSLLFELVAYLFILLYFIATTLTSYYWGVDDPQTLIAYALIIVVSGILIGSRFSFLITLLISSVLIFLAYLQVNGIIEVDVDWKSESLDLMNILEFSVTLGLISVVSWLYNREIGNSLKRVRISEDALKKERDLLEKRVKERTKELQKIQYEKSRQLCQLAEFGRLSSGLFHDLSNYISALLLNMKKIDPNSKGMFSEAKEDLERVEVTMDKVGDFVCAINKQLRCQESLGVFSVPIEIGAAIKVVSYSATKGDIEVVTDFGAGDAYLYGDPIKFGQIITNILINAIDAYQSIEDNREKKIMIVVKKDKGFVIISVVDWACGIPDTLMNKIFKPFFTTKKSDKGMGIGLSNVRELVENDFNGEILVESKKGAGTTFTIKFKDAGVAH